MPEFEHPGDEISQEGMLLAMMTIISDKYTKSWHYKMKNASFAKFFTTFMKRYSYAMFVKLLENKNFRVIMKIFLNSEGFQSEMQTINSMKENQETYENAAKVILSICNGEVEN